MNQQHQNHLKDLIERYPRLFHGQPPTVPSYVPPGWAPLIDRLCASIDHLVVGSGVTFQIKQIKEKFATLGVYYSVSSPQIRSRTDSLVKAAEKESARTCMACGEPGQLRHLVGVSDLCPKGYFTEGVDLPENSRYAAYFATLCERDAEAAIARRGDVS